MKKYANTAAEMEDARNAMEFLVITSTEYARHVKALDCATASSDR
jgi:hypothetical protein